MRRTLSRATTPVPRDSRLRSVDAPIIFSYSEGGFGSAAASAIPGAKQAQPTIAQLTAPDSISGTSGDDVLKTEESSATGLGNSIVTARLVINLQDAAVEKGVVTLTLSGGYRLLTNSNVSLVANTENSYRITVAKDDVTGRFIIKDGAITMDVALVYKPPTVLVDDMGADAGTLVDAHGFYNATKGSISIGFLADGASGAASALSDTLKIGVRAVGSDNSKLTYKDSSNNDWLVLLDNPAGNSVTGGAGDDVITAGAGADTIDGGADFDVVSYQNSGAGVSIALAEGAGVATVGKTGFAHHNSLRNIEGLMGPSTTTHCRGHQQQTACPADPGTISCSAEAGRIRCAAPRTSFSAQPMPTPCRVARTTTFISSTAAPAPSSRNTAKASTPCRSPHAPPKSASHWRRCDETYRYRLRRRHRQWHGLCREPLLRGFRPLHRRRQLAGQLHRRRGGRQLSDRQRRRGHAERRNGLRQHALGWRGQRRLHRRGRNGRLSRAFA